MQAPYLSRKDQLEKVVKQFEKSFTGNDINYLCL